MLAASSASAQQEPETNSVTGTGKGIVGGALLGGEIVMIPMGAAGLKPWWPYLVFGGLGSVGGAIGGWAVEQVDPPPEAPLYMLAGGLALVIPTVVLAANATTRSDYEDTEDPSVKPEGGGAPASPAPGEAPETKPSETPGDGTTVKVETSDARRRQKRARPRPVVSLFDLQRGEVRMGVPALEIKNMYTLEEVAKYGVEQKTEVHVPVLRAAF
jgi:hypothetical protein